MISPVLEGRNKDGISVTVLCHHDILVPAVGASCRKLASIISVEASNGFDDVVQFVGRGQWWGCGCQLAGWW